MLPQLDEKEQIKNLISEHIVFYGKAEKFFKRTTVIESQLDASILNEFRYCARAQKDVLALFFSEDEISFRQVSHFIEPATRALKCVINDCIDRLTTFVKAFTRAISEMYPNVDLAEVYGLEKYIELWEAVVFFDEKISDSRDKLENRVKIYEELLESNQLQIILNFLSYKEVLESLVAKKANIFNESLEKNNREKLFAEESLKATNGQLQVANKQLDEAITARKKSVRLGYLSLIVAALALFFPDQIKTISKESFCFVTRCTTPPTTP